ncbi:helix-turn-helix transcriptional regulator [Persicobacter diffluens]
MLIILFFILCFRFDLYHSFDKVEISNLASTVSEVLCHPEAVEIQNDDLFRVSFTDWEYGDVFIIVFAALLYVFLKHIISFFGCHSFKICKCPLSPDVEKLEGFKVNRCGPAEAMNSVKVKELKRKDEFLIQVEKIIVANISNPNFGVNDITKDMGISRSVFYRRIKKHTDRSVVEIIHGIRLEKAAILLKTTGMQVADIASHTGFNDTSYFIKLFKSHFGTTPGEYRG